jgi:hypothetical protein
MRRILSALALCALGFAANSEPASAEITYPWCAEYGGRDGVEPPRWWSFRIVCRQLSPLARQGRRGWT